MANKLGLEAVVLVADMALYKKMQEMRWTDDNLKHRTFVRPGDFHTVMSYLSMGGKRFSMSGLEDVIAETGVVALGSINGVMSGKMYNRAVRVYKIMSEAFQRCRLDSFVESMPGDQRENFTNLGEKMLKEFPSQGHSLETPDFLAFQEEYER